MLGKKNKILYIVTVFLVIALIVLFFSGVFTKPYGNNEESIVQVINSIEGYESEAIEILEIKDFHDDRVVAFLLNNNPAYIQFTKNPNGDYEWNHIEKRTGQSLDSFVFQLSDDEKLRLMIITTAENNIAKMEITVNEQIIEQEFEENEQSVSWIEIPESSDGSYNFTYQYFDKDGNLIAENER